MQIINATTKVKSVMANNGANFQILPGKVSDPFVATKELIIAATQLGTPKEIGIITGGSWEFEIAKTIPVAAPYLYTDLDEAKAKLIDPTKDYSAKKPATADVLVRQQLLDRTKELSEANKKIDELTKKLETSSSNELISKLNTIISEKTTQSDTLSKRIGELERQLKSANENEQKLRLELSELNTNYNHANTSLEALRKDYANEVAQKEAYKADLDKLPPVDKIAELQNQLINAQGILASKDQEINNLKGQLENASDPVAVKAKVDQMNSEIEARDKQIEDLKQALSSAMQDIESMKASFNEACSKFNITKDDQGNWIQIPNA